MYNRRSKSRIPLVRLLILGLVLRTFIAPGYMLAFSQGGSLGIVFCDGPVSIDSNPAENHSHHKHHGETEDAAISISPTCSYWSTSGIGFITPNLPPPASLQAETTPRPGYDSSLSLQARYTSRSIRAPPSPA